ncbi:MAG: LysR family transcriptional regulator [Deltaproteobacteria bacterium]|nr:LysR family transcriptional regulator [Deltaproteobacteria bacterium]
MPLPPVNAMALFAHVVEAQGFSAAAERLGLS